jgi:hypothetical protein
MAKVNVSISDNLFENAMKELGKKVKISSRCWGAGGGSAEYEVKGGMTKAELKRLIIKEVKARILFFD